MTSRAVSGPPAPVAAEGAPAAPRPARLDLLLLAVAVGNISLSAPLSAATAAPALAIAFWRNAMAVAVLASVLLLRDRAGLRACFSPRIGSARGAGGTSRRRQGERSHGKGPSSHRAYSGDFDNVASVRASRHGPGGMSDARPTAMGRRAVLLSVAAGAVLTLHFGLWLPSLGMTSVASSTALVTTTPIWTTLLLRLRGRRQSWLVWLGIALAFLGVVTVSGVDLALSARALAGDALALGGGVAAAGYVLLGAEVRRTVSTTAYTFVCYSTAALLLLVACLVFGASLGSGYSGQTWLKLVALTATAQLLGHSLINRVVRSIGPSITSTSILLEAPGAALLAALWLGQVPPVAAYPALLLILLGLALVILSDRRICGNGARLVQEERRAAVSGGSPRLRNKCRSGRVIVLDSGSSDEDR